MDKDFNLEGKKIPETIKLVEENRDKTPKP